MGLFKKIALYTIDSHRFEKDEIENLNCDPKCLHCGLRLSTIIKEVIAHYNDDKKRTDQFDSDFFVSL